MEGVCTMWLSELGTFAMFWGLKNPSITETDILWYDLREYVCWFWCNARIFSPSVPWLSLTSIMNYPLCMTHDLATVNRHDHAWTDNWAQNIWKLSKLLTLRRLRYGHQQRGQRGHLYGTKGAWQKFSNLLCLTRCGFHVHLEEDGHFYSNMSMYGRLAERNNCHFSNYPSSQTKLLRSLAFAAMLCRCCSRNGACEAVR